MEPSQLFVDIKNYIDVTWDDEKTNKKIGESVQYGILKFNRINHKENDYTKVGQARNLLMKYCLYDFSNKANEFDNAYRQDLLDFAMDEEVIMYDASIQ